MTDAAPKHYETLEELAADFPEYDTWKRGGMFLGWMRNPAPEMVVDKHVSHIRIEKSLDELAAALSEHRAEYAAAQERRAAP